MNSDVVHPILTTISAIVFTTPPAATATIADRNEAREALTDRLKKLATYLEMVADGDAKKLLGAGFDLRKEPGRGSGSTTTLPAPGDFSVKHGPHSGQVIVHAAKLAGANSYEVYYTDGNSTDDAIVWTDAGTFAGCSRIEIDGLTPGKVYWFRLRAINGAGNGVWTDPASLMVV
ncbi:MAG: fibronectin type III domain-containing protein [Nitrospira sp.]|nr:fibronectin type III domain-containing protein [Nitrospira sp.]